MWTIAGGILLALILCWLIGIVLALISVIPEFIRDIFKKLPFRNNI